MAPLLGGLFKTPWLGLFDCSGYVRPASYFIMFDYRVISRLRCMDIWGSVGQFPSLNGGFGVEYGVEKVRA